MTQEAFKLTGTAGDDTVSLTYDDLHAVMFNSGTIDLGAGIDTIVLASDFRSLDGRGDERLQGVEKIDASLASSWTNIYLDCQTEGFSIFGSNNYDHIGVAKGSDTIYGGGGADAIYGGYGNDALEGGAVNDWIDGAAGNDWIDGGAGNDTIYSGDGDNTLEGGAGNDRIEGGS